MFTKKSPTFCRLRKWAVILMSFYFAFPIIVNAQSSKKAYIWYFGDKAGIDFSSGTPVPLANSALQSFEGSTVATTASGELLFYSNGGSMPYVGAIWNRNHQMMPNGNLAGAGGCNSAFQSVITVPLPGSTHLHYVFTTDCMENSGTGGLRYNVVDMNLDGGLGDVVLKGIKLTGPVDESLTAIQHKNGKDWWIITHKLNTDSFYVYLLTATGISGVVKTKIGLTTPDYAGAIVASANGQRLVHCGLSFTTLYRFDNATGKITDPVYLSTHGYSAAFSPNCKLLYVADGMGKNIYQFDLTATDIAASRVTIGTTAAQGVGYMQLGPDGKIYVAKFVTATHLGVIEQPNVSGSACTYVDNGFYLGGRMTRGGLPNFPNNYVGECASYSIDRLPGTALHPDLKSVTINGAVTVLPLPGKAASLTVMSRKKGDREWQLHPPQNHMAIITDIEENTEYEFKIVSSPDDVNYQPLPEHNIYQLLDQIRPDDNGRESMVLTSRHEAGNLLQGGPRNSSLRNNSFDFSLSPNPASQYVHIELMLSEMPSDITISLLHADGTEVKTQAHSGLRGAVSITLPLDEVPAGLYLIRAIVTNQINTVSGLKKLIVGY